MKKAKDIWRLDLEVDRLHQENNGFCQTLVEKDPTQASSVFETLFISKSLERVCDHAVNISKEVVLSLPVEMFVMLRNIKNPPSARK